MGRETWALVRLEHPIRKCVLFGHGEVGLNVRRIHIHELRVREWRRATKRSPGTRGWDEVGAVHRAYPGGRIQVAHLYERAVAVVQIVVIRVSADGTQGDRAERDGRALRIHSAARDVILRGGWACAFAGTAGPVRRKAQPLKQVVGRAILLEDDHDVRQIIVWRRRNT